MDERKNILVVGFDKNTFDRVAPPLLRRIFEIDWIPSADAAVELAKSVPFAALLVNYPLQSMPMNDFLRLIRAAESASRSCIISLVSSSGSADNGSQYKEKGVDLLLSLDDPAAKRENLLCTLLGIQPRRSTRVMVQLNVTLDDGRLERYIAQTKDLSETGMFVMTQKIVPIGTIAKFKLTLPDNPNPIRGEAKIMRHAEPTHDSSQGMGLQFQSFSAIDDAVRLANHLEAFAHH